MSARSISRKHTVYTVEARGMRCLSDVHLVTVRTRLMKIAPGGLERVARTRQRSLARVAFRE